MKHPRQSTTEWLWSRQEGRGSKFTQRFFEASTARFNPSVPSSIIAWNANRLQNMILAAGPSTPAARACRVDRTRQIFYADDSENESNSDDTNSQAMAEDNDSSSLHPHPESQEEMDSASSVESNPAPPDESGSESENETNLSDTEMNDTNAAFAPPGSQRSWVPLIRHESCINTACWIDTPWRLSVSAHRETTVVDSWETPTQLITSGDDHMVKFWDLRHSLGSTSPVSGGWDVFTPFSTPSLPSSTSLSTSKCWRVGQSDVPSGAVIPLASLASGHLGNVFHATPVPSKPGLILTCGGDGQLRSCHLERQQTSNLIMRPVGFSDEEDSDSDGYYSMRLGLAYCHQLLTENTGLLCCDRGLFRFDMRLAPREQPRQPFKLTPNKRHGWRSYASKIKACAVWSPSLGTEKARQSHIVDSNYVFAGGSGEEVHLFDLRMEHSQGSSNRVVERYRPRQVKNAENVSVSGLDVSKNGRELLVSYESDQIYTFPIFNRAASSAGPEMQEIDDWSMLYMDDPDEAVPDLASYGAHLNRFTFLKSAKYAGPNDEYICTGSDSGHAWIYRKSDGIVASLLSADSHVCNGVVPHPTLPAFITYGIDSTAKVWRATLPVTSSSYGGDVSVDSTKKCPFNCPTYQMSPVVKNPEQVQQRISSFDDSTSEITVFPDFIPTTQEVLCSGRFIPNMLWAMVGNCDGAPRIGNALRTLPKLLRSNRYECCRDANAEREGPIEGPLESLGRRISMMRLHHQASQVGLTISNPDHPYLWRVARAHAAPPHPADIVPDYPSDWISWDPKMNQNPEQCLPNFTLEGHPTVESREAAQILSSLLKNQPDNEPLLLSRYQWLAGYAKGGGDDVWWPNHEEPNDDTEQDKDKTASPFSLDDILFSRKVLYYTALVCKEGGNEALKNNCFEVAAHRYDKAIQYCAVAFLAYESASRHVPHLTRGMCRGLPVSDNDTGRRMAHVYTWCPLLRIWIGCHLNLSLFSLKSAKFQGDARNQAEIALRLLAPYTKEKGKVFHEETETILSETEPESTYHEARQFQAKAFFRLGTAELEMGDYLSAAASLEASIASTDGDADPITQKKLRIAKSRSASQKKRNRRRFELALSAGGGDSGTTAAADTGK